MYIKYSKDKEKMQEVTQADKSFQSLDRQAAEVINVTTNSKLKYPEGKEKIDMYLALEEMRMDSEIKGAVETYQEVSYSLQETCRRVSEKFNLPLQRAEEESKKYWK